jgi:hypothetical protein
MVQINGVKVSVQLQKLNRSWKTQAADLTFVDSDLCCNFTGVSFSQAVGNDDCPLLMIK